VIVRFVDISEIIDNHCLEEFEDTIEVIRIRKSKKDR